MMGVRLYPMTWFGKPDAITQEIVDYSIRWKCVPTQIVLNPKHIGFTYQDVKVEFDTIVGPELMYISKEKPDG
jgi:hypothetical protein